MKLAFRSFLDIAPDELWRRINNFEKLNMELAPFLKMSCPEIYKTKPFDEFPTGNPVFKSVIFLLRVIPVDVSNVRFVSISPGMGFSEDSAMICSSSWKHKRSISPDGAGCLIIDELDITPRLSIFKPVLYLFTKMTFFIRHRNLRQSHGYGGKNVR
jgi:hypothetical protein